MLSKLPGFDMKCLTIIDQSEVIATSPVVHAACEMGSVFIRMAVTRENWNTILSQHLRAGDTIIDLTFGINCIDVLSWCQEHEIRYINTAVEKWEDELIPDNAATWIDQSIEDKEDWTLKHKDLYDRTLYARHQDITNNGYSGSGPTAVLEHGIISHPTILCHSLTSLLGCNPGLVSHFVRAALDDIVADLIKSVPSSLVEELRVLHSSGDYPRIAHALGLRVIHISEIDTQTSSKYVSIEREIL